MNEVQIIESEQLTKKGTIRKRAPKTKNTYFTEETEDAIIRYRLETKLSVKNTIYSNIIHPAFYKLVENIIHSFKFYYIDTESIEDLKYEVISFLIQKIHLYEKNKGKAFSYFGTIAKRYLITYNKKNYKNIISKVDIVDIVKNEDTKVNEVFIDRSNDFDIDTRIVFNNFLNHMELKVLDMFSNPSETKVAANILEIFKKVGDMSSINKKLIYFCVKEATGEDSVIITKVIKKLKIVYKDCLEKEIKRIQYANIYN
jgi:hypothetical protein